MIQHRRKEMHAVSSQWRGCLSKPDMKRARDIWASELLKRSEEHADSLVLSTHPSLQREDKGPQWV